jgi:hypothetical protein
MNLLLRVCESSTSHVSIDRFAFCSNLSARISSSVRRWIRKKERRSVIIIELCESYNASSKREARDELVVMTRDATEDEMSLLNMFFTWKKTFLAYDDVTVLFSLRFSFSKDWVVNNFIWRQKCVASARCLRDVVVQRVVETVVKWSKYCDV